MVTEKKPAKSRKSGDSSNIVQVIVNESAANPTDGPLKKQDLMMAVAEATGMAKNQVRKVLDEAFTQINDALASGRAVRIPPLGKAKPVGKPGDGKHAHARVTLFEKGDDLGDKTPLEAAGE